MAKKPLEITTVCENYEQVVWILKDFLGFRRYKNFNKYIPEKGSLWFRKHTIPGLERTHRFSHDKAEVKGLKIHFTYGYKQSS